MAGHPLRFFLQAIDSDHGCPVLETTFLVEDVEELRKLVNPDSTDTSKLENYDDVGPDELLAIKKRSKVAFDPGDRQVRIRSWHSIRGAPYLIHTDYELMLLLEGRKKFARMGEQYPPPQHYNEHFFDKYVVIGLIHKEIALKPFPKPFKTKDGCLISGIREVYYTAIGEEWRINAWKLIDEASRKVGWNQSFERLEGMLFGYEDWQMDWWIARYKKPFH